LTSLKIINNGVKSEVFGPIFIAQNDYIKLVTLQHCWMHLHVVMVAFQFILSPIEINGQYCVIGVSQNVSEHCYINLDATNYR
jgi:hypothetical protein